ncbi:uncharacterized protein LOC135828238 [Sycon ciliatum]|uniref:uncharacterized protein LOC135828238 n=4 Tax=Sycon ciliatum TaxID=27933 RepID=UPI0031F63915
MIDSMHFSPSVGQTMTPGDELRTIPHESTPCHNESLLHVLNQRDMDKVEVRQSLLLPSAKNTKAWHTINAQLKIHLTQHFPTSYLKNTNIEETLDKLENFIHWFFDQKPPPPPPKHKNANKNRAVEKLRAHRRDLKRQFRKIKNPDEVPAALRNEYFSIGKQIKRLLKQQKMYDDRSRNKRDQDAFLKDPYAFGKKLFQPTNHVKPTFSDTTCFEYFQHTYADQDRATSYESCPSAGKPRDCTHPVDEGTPTWTEFQNVLKKCRNTSAPGPDKIPYIVWKLCPSLQSILFTIFGRVWESKIIPRQWQVACITLLAKGEVSDDPSKFRPIALANTSGKIFFTLVAKRLLKHMLGNKFFDGDNQKGFMPAKAGCLEHTSLCYEAMRDAKTAKRQICIAWIDLKNAFGSVRHNLIQYALTHYSLPLQFRKLIFSYYDSLCAFVVQPHTPTFNYNIGVFQGCPLSPVLFNICFQLLLDSLAAPELSCLSYDFKSAPLQVSQTAFADDLGLYSKSSAGCQKLIAVTEDFLSWTQCMQAAPHKCKSSAAKLVDGRYKPYDPCLTMSGRKIAFIDITQGFVRELHFMCLPFLKKWSGLPRCANSAILFIGSRKRFGLRLHYLPTVWKKCQSIKWHILRSSGDARMRALYTLRRSKDAKLTKRYAATIELECAEASVGSGTLRPPSSSSHRAGLGARAPKQHSKPPRKDLLQTFEEINAQEQILRLKTLQVQGKWLEWTSVMWQDLSWKSLLYGGTGKDLKFLLASTLDVLPSPTNLRRWGNTVVDPYCSLCRTWACTTRHVLGACRVALDQGRYTWRHDNVLGVIVRNMREEIRIRTAANTVQTENSNELDFISFCKAGEKPVRVQPRRKLVTTDLLSAASDWKLLVDSVSAKISFPSCVALTTLRPDIVLYSTSRRIVFWMELTVCAEDRFSVSNSRKDRRYADLADQCRANGWQVVSFSVEVGVRGFIPDSLRRALKALGFSNRRIKFICNLCSKTSLRSSYIIWLRRQQKHWSEDPLF